MRYLLFLVAVTNVAPMVPPDFSRYKNDQPGPTQDNDITNLQDRLRIEGNVTPPTPSRETANDAYGKNKETADQRPGTSNSANSSPTLPQDGHISYGSSLDEQNQETRKGSVPVNVGQNLAGNQDATQPQSWSSGNDGGLTTQNLKPEPTIDRGVNGFSGQPNSNQQSLNGQVLKNEEKTSTESAFPAESSKKKENEFPSAISSPISSTSNSASNQKNAAVPPTDGTERQPSIVTKVENQDVEPNATQSTPSDMLQTQSTFPVQNSGSARAELQNQIEKTREFVISGLITVPATTPSYNSDGLFPQFVSSMEDEKPEATYPQSITPDASPADLFNSATSSPIFEFRKDNGNEVSTPPTPRQETSQPTVVGQQSLAGRDDTGRSADVVKVFGEANANLANEELLDKKPRVVKVGKYETPWLSEHPVGSTEPAFEASSISIVKRIDTSDSAKNNTGEPAANETTAVLLQTLSALDVEKNATLTSAENADEKAENVTAPAEKETENMAMASLAATNETEGNLASELTTSGVQETTVPNTLTAEEVATNTTHGNSKASANAMVVSGNVKAPSKTGASDAGGMTPTSQPEVVSATSEEATTPAEVLVSTKLAAAKAKEEISKSNETSEKLPAQLHSVSVKENAVEPAGNDSKSNLTSSLKQETVVFEGNVTAAGEKESANVTKTSSEEVESSADKEGTSVKKQQQRMIFGSSGGVNETVAASESNNTVAKKPSQVGPPKTDIETEASGQELEETTPSNTDEVGSGETTSPVESTTVKPAIGKSKPIKTKKRSDVVEGVVKAPGILDYGFAVEEPSATADVSVKDVQGVTGEDTNALSSDNGSKRGFSSLPVKKIGGTTRRQWRPYRMDCATEEDDKGEMCMEWARSGLCLTHKPTMFLFCRKTCLCTGPPEY